MYLKLLRHAPRAGAVIAFTALAAVLTLGVGAPAASAHDSVQATTPGDTEQIGSAPTQVNVVFTDDILQLGTVLLVVDEGGTDWAAGQPVVDGPAVSQAVSAEMPDGDYQVRWRVVSADGHPISGTFDFGVGAGDAVFTDTSAAAPAPPAENESSPSTSPSARPTRTLPVALIGTFGAVGGLAIFSLVLLLLRRPGAQTPTRTSASPTTIPTRTDTAS